MTSLFIAVKQSAKKSITSGSKIQAWHQLNRLGKSTSHKQDVSANFLCSIQVKHLIFHLNCIKHHGDLQNILLSLGCSFVTPYGKGQLRYVSTTPMKIGLSYILQFDLDMGCGSDYNLDIDNKVNSFEGCVHT